jgi:hypothetical protein
MDFHLCGAHLLDIVAVNSPRPSIEETVMLLVILRGLKALSRAIVEGKMQRIERELMLRGIPYQPFPRQPQ